MNDAEELAALRRLAELEAKAGGFQSTGGGAALGGHMQTVGQDRGGQTTDVPYVIGGNASEALSNIGASPEVAGAGGAAVNAGMNLAPMLIGSGIGAATGRAAASGVRGIGSLINKAKNVVDPWLPGGIERAVGRTANAAAGPDRDAIINALRQNEQIVPGSMPTAGQAAAPVGRAEFSGLQEAIKGRLPTDYDAIAQAQNAARIKALRSVGQDKAALESAITDRSSAAATNYGAVRNQVVNIDPQLGELLSNPILQAPLKRAQLLSAGRGSPVDLKGGEVTVGQLQDMKMALDDVIKDPQTFGIGASEASLIGQLKKRLVGIVGEQSPAWNTARETFAEQSKPINQMEVGQYLEGKLTPALNDQGASGSQRAAAYAQALRDAPGTIKRATGQPRYDELGQVLTPSQMDAVGSVGQDLARTATHERLARAGAEKASELVGQVTPKVPAAGMFNPKYSVMRAVINRLEGKVEGKSLDRLAAAMQNPPELAKIMEGMSPRSRAAIVKAIQDEALQNRIMTGGGAIAGGALGYQQGNQP